MRFFGIAALIGLAGYWIFNRDTLHVHARTLRASWYGERERGKPTASGEIFDPKKFTCASWEFYGKTLRVSHGGKSVVVRCQDKGPAKRLLKTRSLDLSRAAFLALAPLDKGLIDVTIEEIKYIQTR